MKTSFVSLLALAAGAFASPIGSVGALVGRDQTVTLSTLTAAIKTYTSSISKAPSSQALVQSRAGQSLTLP